MNIKKLKEIYVHGAQALRENEPMLSALDAETGDGDHGVTISRIADAVIEVGNDDSVCNEKEFFDGIFSGIMAINGGSIGPLWAMMMDGVGENVQNEMPADGHGISRMLQGALKGIGTASDAVPGDKTLVDPLAAAACAAQKAEDKDWKETLEIAARAARDGAQATRDMPAKYGRAKNLPDKGTGHLDPGAVSLSVFLQALSEYANTM